MDVTLRAAQAGDRRAVAEVFGAARDAALSFLPVVHTAQEHVAYFGGLVDRGGVTVAVAGGEVAGFLAACPGRVEHLYVGPEHWRRGIGSRLLRAVQAAQPGGLELWVFQRNVAAIAFYERHGFAVVEQTDGAGNEEREPDARMVWPGR